MRCWFFKSLVARRLRLGRTAQQEGDLLLGLVCAGAAQRRRRRGRHGRLGRLVGLEEPWIGLFAARQWAGRGTRTALAHARRGAAAVAHLAGSAAAAVAIFTRLAGSAAGARRAAFARRARFTLGAARRTALAALVAAAAGRREAGQVAARDGLLDQLLDVGQQALVLVRINRDGIAGGAGAAGAADAVHIVLGVVRQVVVDDAGQVGDVEAARGDVGGDQHVDLALLERLQRGDAFLLRLVAVDGGGVHALLLQAARQARGADLGVGEDDHLLQIALAQDVRDQRMLLVFLDLVDHLRDALGRRIAARHFDRQRVVQEGVGQLFDFRREGGREHQVLALLRQQV